jgi:hypothetical protein
VKSLVKSLVKSTLESPAAFSEALFGPKILLVGVKAAGAAV